jgi:uncharacterized protein (DUF433 family)
MIELAPGIVVDPGIRFGTPVIQGTRVAVELVLAGLGGGMDLDEVAEEYALTREDIRAALSYAARVVASEEIRGTA